MLGIIAKNTKEMFSATLYEGRDDDQGEYFEFYYAAEASVGDEKQLVPNLLSESGREIIATSWDLGFAENQFVEIGADMYRINDISLNRNAGRAGVNRVALNPLAEYQLTLVKVGNPKAVLPNG